MDNNFTLTEYLELLKLEKKFENDNKNFYQVDSVNSKRLGLYKLNICDYTFWSRKKIYNSFTAKFLKSSISSEVFCDKFYSLWSICIHDKNSRNLAVKIQPNKKAANYYQCIERIFDICEDFDPATKYDYPLTKVDWKY